MEIQIKDPLLVACGTILLVMTYLDWNRPMSFYTKIMALITFLLIIKKIFKQIKN